MKLCWLQVGWEGFVPGRGEKWVEKSICDYGSQDKIWAVSFQREMRGGVGGEGLLSFLMINSGGGVLSFRADFFNMAWGLGA